MYLCRKDTYNLLKALSLTTQELTYMALQIFRTKPIAPHGTHTKGLNRCLSAWDLAFLGVGAIIGTGIFVLTGIAAATQAGPAVILSFVIAGLACAFAALHPCERAHLRASGVAADHGCFVVLFAAFDRSNAPSGPSRGPAGNNPCTAP